MTHYSKKIQNIIKTPETINEAVEQLMLILTDIQKSEVASLPENELLFLHFTIGVAIRDGFNLHDLNSPLFKDCKVEHPDDASGVIIKALWGQLKDLGF